MIASCKEVTRIVSQGLDRNLGLGERLRLRVHLAICDGCRNFRKQMLLLRQAMVRLAESADE